MLLESVDCDRKKIFFLDPDKNLVDIPINWQLSEDLKRYIEQTKELHKSTNILFVTSKGKPIFRTRFTQVLEKASKKAKLGFTPTLKMIQKSYLNEMAPGFTQNEIWKFFKLRIKFMLP